MKTFAIIAASFAVATLLSACGDKKEKVYAVDRVEAAQQAALEKAPKAEEMIFDDHGQPTFAQTAAGGASAASAAATDAKDSADTAVDAAADTQAEDKTADVAVADKTEDAAKDKAVSDKK